MNRILQPRHRADNLYYGSAKMLERASYYGLKSLLILYMTGDELRMHPNNAIAILGWVTSGLVVSKIIGALLGDLWLGNKKAILLGGLLQTVGILTMCIPTVYVLYVGLFLMVVGNGLFNPNLTANYGKAYLDNPPLLDAGFTLFYLLTNVGSLAGVLLVGYWTDRMGYTSSFALLGLLSLLTLPLVGRTKTAQVTKTVSLKVGVVNIALVLFLIGLFSGLYEIASIRVYDVQYDLSELEDTGFSQGTWQSMNTLFLVPLGLLAILVWTYFYQSPYFKLFLGFVFAGLGCLPILFIPEIPQNQHHTALLLGFAFLILAEIHILPLVDSVLTQYANPKYLAILVSLSFVPTELMLTIFGLFNAPFYDDPIWGLQFGMGAMFVMGTVVAAGLFLVKKNQVQTGH